MPKLELQNIVIKELEEQKIEDIICIDTSRISSLADYVIIGSGRSGKHAESSMENLKTFLKQKQGINGQLSGTSNDGWIVLDLGNVIIHLFEPKVRKIYKLEELFKSRANKAEKKSVKKTVTKKTTTKVKKTSTKKIVAKKVSVKKPLMKKSKEVVAKKTNVKKTKVVKAKKPVVKKASPKKQVIKKVVKKK